MEGWIRRWLGHGTSMDGWCTCLVSGRRRGRSNTPSPSLRFWRWWREWRRCGVLPLTGRLRSSCAPRHRMRSAREEPSTYPCIEMLAEDRAQATVEAALLIPSFLLLLLLMLQPVCLLYTRAIMESAAAETARLMTTATLEDDEAYRAFALRRLSAIPDLAIFHAGGSQSWEIECGRAADTGGTVRVSIEGRVRPLPILGAFAGAMGEVNGYGDVRMRVDVSYEGRPEWLEGEYAEWVEMWDT